MKKTLFLLNLLLLVPSLALGLQMTTEELDDSIEFMNEPADRPFKDMPRGFKYNPKASQGNV